MGSIYPHFEGTRWDRLGYDSYDFNQCARFIAVHDGNPIITNKRKFRVLAHGRGRCTVWAETIAEAKAIACSERGWNVKDIYDVHIVHH